MPNTEVPPPAGNNNDVELVFKTCALFTDCIGETNNIQIDNAKDIDVVMPIYNLIECSDIYSQTYRSLRQYDRDESTIFK